MDEHTLPYNPSGKSPHKTFTLFIAHESNRNSPHIIIWNTIILMTSRSIPSKGAHRISSKLDLNSQTYIHISLIISLPIRNLYKHFHISKIIFGDKSSNVIKYIQQIPLELDINDRTYSTKKMP